MLRRFHESISTIEPVIFTLDNVRERLILVPGVARYRELLMAQSCHIWSV